MSDEKVTTYETPGHTTVIHEGSSRSGGAAGWFFGLVALIAILAAVYMLAIRDNSESAKDNAIANAATQVGDAAQKVGNAAQDAANNLEPAK